MTLIIETQHMGQADLNVVLDDGLLPGSKALLVCQNPVFSNQGAATQMNLPEENQEKRYKLSLKSVSSGKNGFKKESLLSLDAYNPAAICTSYLMSSNNSGVYMDKA